MAASQSLVIADKPGLPAEAASVDGLLARIRPEWQAKRLVQRVSALLPVDPSSACQRLLNAAIKDLQSKIVIAGIDLAAEAAKLHSCRRSRKPMTFLRTTRRRTPSNLLIGSACSPARSGGA